MSLPENDYQMFIKTMVNLERIEKEELEFIEDYTLHMNGMRRLYD